MSFDFVMDAFPAYTKFDKTHKCLCALQVIGGDQNAAAEESVECPEPAEKAFSVVSVSAEPFDSDADWSEEEVKTIAKFGRNLSAAINGSDIDFYGTVVSGVDVDELVPQEDQTGYYVPVTINLSPAAFIADVDKYGKFHMSKTAEAQTQYKFIKPIDQDVPVVTMAVFDELGTQVEDAAEIAAGNYGVVVEVPAQGQTPASVEYYEAPSDAEFYSLDFSNINFR